MIRISPLTPTSYSSQNNQNSRKYLFWCPTLEITGENEDHTPSQTRIPKEVIELKEEKKLNPTDNAESRMKLAERFDWTDTLLTQAEKNAVQDLLVEYHDIFARHRMDIGILRSN